MMKRFIAALILFILDGLSMLVFKSFPERFFPGYRALSKKWIFFLSKIFSFTGIAVWDIGALFLFALAIGTLIYTVVKKRSFLKWLSHVVLLVSLLCFVAVEGWMLNHYAFKLKEDLNLNVEEYSIDQLYEAADYYFEKAAEYALLIERDKNGHALAQDFKEMASIAGSSYEKLEESYPVFEGSNLPVKRLSLAGEYLLYNGIVGIFMPITGEAGVPEHVPVIPLAYTMAHEAGHRLGLAGEEEANFAAFLACEYNEDDRFVYSGYYNAFSYCFSALYRNDPDRAKQLYYSHEGLRYDLVRLDRRDTSEAYQKYDSPLQKVSDQINDSYLKTFSQEGGVKSYGFVSDYLIAWYLSGR